ncbi:hypothetical protein JNW91_00680 [Micromonospora sp. STR1_7]|uniref:Uncharacterized protein n=1 Tax=Micromonospora parastrephiae TaxID=2806101 RepID=A0ABS1XMN0_9ACTN|nr:hypothetical protein [Micromonospora parastrephiae]MBM0230517.1 hypothetical protein [Micromonospora parastrephiae]
MTALTAPTMKLRTLPATDRRRDVYTLLDGATRTVSVALARLDLCDHVPAWPADPEATAYPPRTVRAAAAQIAQHARDDRCDRCVTRHHQMRAAARLAELWLDLWRACIRYITQPQRFPFHRTQRAAAWLADYVAWVITGRPHYLLGQPA